MYFAVGLLNSRKNESIPNRLHPFGNVPLIYSAEMRRFFAEEKEIIFGSGKLLRNPGFQSRSREDDAIEITAVLRSRESRMSRKNNLYSVARKIRRC